MSFNESSLEKVILMDFLDLGYEYINGNDIHRMNSELLLRDDLVQYLKNMYTNEEIVDIEIEKIILRLNGPSTGDLYSDNKEIFSVIRDGFILKRENPNKKDIFIRLIDFETVTNNEFKVCNQVEIKGTEVRIPDTIIYINGIPIVVLEFKTAIREDTTIYDAYEQLSVRYRRDIPDLFIYNAFVVISDGVNSKFGSIFTPYEYFYSWNKINAEDKVSDGIDSLKTMIFGLFAKDKLLKVLKDYVYFPDTSTKEMKIVCRYPQFFAAEALYNNILAHKKPLGDGKGGTYFGATGSGKSFAMLFLARKLMRSKSLKSPTIILITDRTDLDGQLSGLFCNSKNFIGDNTVISIESKDDLKVGLRHKSSGGVFLTTIQKFTEDLDLLSERENVICISDEAHRSQLNLEQKITITESGVQRSYGFAKYLHDSLPNATFVGFTGTPIDETIDVFGPVIDSYTMRESVIDGITVKLIYEGRAAKVTLKQEEVEKIEDYYLECENEGANEYQIEESKRKAANLNTILANPQRIKNIAEDFIEHYEKRVEEGATVEGKALFVCATREIAYSLFKEIISRRPNWNKAILSEDQDHLATKDLRELKPIEKIKMVMTRNANDPKELWDLLGTKEFRKELDRQFKNIKSNFKIAIVVDMWLTGFDIPALDSIYIDKPIQEHTLIQTISRVNRVYEGKEKGLIIDYIGIKNNMNKALFKYTNGKEQEFDSIDEAVKIVKDQLEILGQIFYKFDKTGFFSENPKVQLDTLKMAVEFVQVTEDLENRFMANVKRLSQAFKLCTTSEEITDIDRNNIHFYLAIRSVIFKLTKGDAPDIAQMNAKVRAMIENALQSDGVVELFVAEKGTTYTEDILSEDYLRKVMMIKMPNMRIKILTKLLQNAITEYKKVNKIQGTEFSDRLKKIVDDYNNRRKDKKLASEVLDDIAEQFAQLLEELKRDKNSFISLGIDFEEKAFYDILKATAQKHNFEYPEEKLLPLSKEVKKIVQDKSQYTDWAKREDIKAELKVALILKLAEFGYPPVLKDEVFKEVFEQAENFKKYQD